MALPAALTTGAPTRGPGRHGAGGSPHPPTRFSGCVEGLPCVTFSPDGPPALPTVPPFVFTTRGSAEQALAASDAIVTDGLRPEAS